MCINREAGKKCAQFRKTNAWNSQKCDYITIATRLIILQECTILHSNVFELEGIIILNDFYENIFDDSMYNVNAKRVSPSQSI